MRTRQVKQVLVNAVSKEIAHSRPFFGKEEEEAVAAVVRSGYVAQGSVVEEVESLWCRFTRTKYAACVSSGLSAVRLSLLALNIGPGDSVIVPAYSCVALLNAVLAVGARPILADVMLDEWTLSKEDLAARVQQNTKAIIAVHLFGKRTEIGGLSDFGLPVIEDCAHAVAPADTDQIFGSAGRINVSSFYATKLVSGGEGGIVGSNDSSIISFVTSGRNYVDQHPNGSRLNEKMTDLEAALVLAQLKKLPNMLHLRLERAQRYSEMLAPLVEAELIVLPDQNASRVWYRYVIRLLRHRAVEICEWMWSRGVRIEQPVTDFRTGEYSGKGLPNSDIGFQKVVSLPLYPNLEITEQTRVCDLLNECLRSRP